MRILGTLLTILCFLPTAAFAFHNASGIYQTGCGGGTISTSFPHGTVGDLIPIHESGPPDQRYDIVLLPEGYSADTDEQDLFVEHANLFKDALLNQFAFNTCLDNFNIWGVHVKSDDSGIDFPCSEHAGPNPQPCQPAGDTCPGGTDRLLDTYFNATLCPGEHHRLLDLDLARLVADTKLGCGNWESAIVLVNSEYDFGRASGQIGYASTRHTAYPNLAIHELGHTFVLGDEYCNAAWSWPFTWDPANPPPAQPTEPSAHNWTYEQDPARLKWRELIPPGVPIPTTENAGCAECDSGADTCPTQCDSRECKPRCLDQLVDDPCQNEPAERPSWCQPDDWTVGLYSGMNHGLCGGFRPAFYYTNPDSAPTPTLCMMNLSGDVAQSFCPVCSRAIVNELAAYNHGFDRFEPNGEIFPRGSNCSNPGSLLADLGNLADQPGVFQRHFDPAIHFSQESWRVALDELTLHSELDNDWLRVFLPDPTAVSLHVGEESQHGGLPTECGSVTISGRDLEGATTTEPVFFNAAATVALSPRGTLGGEAVRIDGFPMRGQDRLSKTVRCPFQSGFSTLSIRIGREQWLAGTGLGCPGPRACHACPSCADYALSVGYAVDVLRIPQVPEWFRALHELEILSSLPCPHGGFFPRCQRLELEPLIFTHPPVPRPGECGPADGCRFYHAFVWEGTAPFELLLSSDVDLSYELLDMSQTVLAEALPIDIDGPGGPSEVLASFMDDDERITKRLAVANLLPGLYVLLVAGTEATFSIDFEPPPPAPDSDGDGVSDPFDPCPLDAEDLDGTRDGDGCPDPVIDIKPGSAENPINLRSRGVIPVALLGEASLDVTQLDVDTLRFGRCGFVEARPAHDLGDTRRTRKHVEDVNGDGHVDLVTHYRQSEAKFVAGDDEACLVVNNLNGAPLLGIDAIKIVF
jgi:hypothetical protein